MDTHYLERQRKLEARQSERESRQKLYEETMIKDAIGDPPTGLSDKKLKFYEEAVERLRKDFQSEGRVKVERGVDRKTLLKTLLKLTSS